MSEKVGTPVRHAEGKAAALAERPFSRGRFAPSATGEVHPGTLLAGLLCWLDARRVGAEVILRLEDLDPERTKPGYLSKMEADLAWFGLDWNERFVQSEARARHEEAIESLVRSGLVYACECTRAEIREGGRLAPDGSYAYSGKCRSKSVDVSNWRDDPRPLRLVLSAGGLNIPSEGSADWTGDPSVLFGDPLLRRRDRAYAYHLVSVVDDAHAGVDRVTRGKDLGPSTLLQAALQKMLGFEPPSYRHHSLFLERRGEKLSKLHGAVGAAALRERYDAEALCGELAHFIGLVPKGTRCRPEDLVASFDWALVSEEDVELRWDPAIGLSLAGGLDSEI